MPEWVIEQLAGHHDCADFDCGKPPLSEWLTRYAGQNTTRDIGRTYVAVHPDEPRVFGYYSLSTGQVVPAIMPAPRAKKLPKNQPVPTALIGRLAVDRSIQGQGLGVVLLLDALARIQRLADELGIHAIVVDAIDDQAGTFYRKHGFEAFLDDPLHLFITLKVVRQLGLNPPSP